MNSRYLLIVLCIFSTSPLNAQTTNEFTKDLDHLYSILKKTPSYKAQIKGHKKNEFFKLYEDIKAESVNAASDISQFFWLSQLLMPLKDNHLYFYQSSSIDLRSKLPDSSFVNEYRTSQAFIDYPKVSTNLDSLEEILKTKSTDSVEGIYFYENYIKVGLYRTLQRDSLVGLILETKNPFWKPGQVAFLLKEHSTNHFRAYHADIFQKTFGLNKNEKFQHNSLTESNWKKFPNQIDHVNLSSKIPVFRFRGIAPEIQYLRIGTFATSSRSLIESQKFYNIIKDSLTASHLILDLRNNGGGGFKASRKYLTLLKGFSKRGQIFALINNRTISNAEEFAIKLKRLKNVQILGEISNGTLTYGNNSGQRESLPSGKFKLYITDMKGSRKNLRYEEVGVPPDLNLSPNHNWIDQVINLIARE